jgi:hypothetical protein
VADFPVVKHTASDGAGEGVSNLRRLRRYFSGVSIRIIRTLTGLPPAKEMNRQVLLFLVSRDVLFQADGMPPVPLGSFGLDIETPR